MAPVLPRQQTPWHATGRLDPMKTLLLVIAVLVVCAAGALALANVAFDSRSVRTHTIEGSVREIVVTSHSGDVDLVPGDGRVVVRETMRYVFEKPTLTRSLDDGVLTLKTRCEGFDFNCSTDLRITVPPGVKITIDAGSGDIEGRRLAVGGAHVESDSGDVSLELTGRQALVRAHTDSGSVDVVAADARSIDAETDSGDVTVDAAGSLRRIVAHTDSGDVEVRVPRGDYAIEADTDSGKVDIDDAISRNDRAPRSIDAETDSGDVEIRAR